MKTMTLAQLDSNAYQIKKVYDVYVLYFNHVPLLHRDEIEDCEKEIIKHKKVRALCNAESASNVEGRLGF